MPQATTAKRIADNIRAKMRETGYNQTDLGRIAGCSQSAFSRRLLGQAEFSVSQLDAIAKALGVTVAELLDDPANTATAAR